MYPHERSLVKDLEGRPCVIIGVNSEGDREHQYVRAEKGDNRPGTLKHE